MFDDPHKIHIGVRCPDGNVYCLSCGSEGDWEECYECCGDGGHDAYDEDPLMYDPGDMVACNNCNWRGGFHWCENKECETKEMIEVITAPNVGPL